MAFLNMPLHQKIQAFLLFLASLFIMTACTPEPTVRLNKEDRTLIDSLYKKQLPTLQFEVDSICALERKQILKTAVDSILQARLAERKKRLGY